MIKKSLALALMTATCLGAVSAPAVAETETDWLAKERFQIRGRLIDVMGDGDGEVTQNGLKTDVGHAITPEVDLSYFLTDHIALELIAATSQHEIDAAHLNLGEAWVLPPTLTLQYHFNRDNTFSPYIGAGINYSLFYGENDGSGFDDLDVDGGFGWAAQVGFDYWLNDNWGLNFDVKYIDVDVDVDVTSGGVPLDARDVDLDPWIVGVGMSYRF